MRIRSKKEGKKEGEKNPSKTTHVLLSSVPSATSCRGLFSNRSTFQGLGPGALASAIAAESPPGPPPTTTARRGFGEVEVEVEEVEEEVDELADARIDRCIVFFFFQGLLGLLSLVVFFGLAQQSRKNTHGSFQLAQKGSDLKETEWFPRGEKMRKGQCFFLLKTGAVVAFFCILHSLFSLSLSSLSLSLSLLSSLFLSPLHKTLFLASSSFLTTSSGVLSSAFAIAALAAAGSEEKRSHRSPSTTCLEG